MGATPTPAVGTPDGAHVDQPGRVVETALAPPKVIRTAPDRSPRSLWHRPRGLLALQMIVMLSVGVTGAVLVNASFVTTGAVLLLSLVVRFHGGRAAIRPGLPHPGRMATDMALPFAAVGVAVAFAGYPAESLRDAGVLVLTVCGVDVAGTLLRRRLHRPIRVLVVGDGAAISRAATRWGGDRAVKVVGALLLDDADDNPPVSTLEGVRTIRGIDEVAEWADLWVANLVVVAPGPGVTSDSVRRLGWMLERSDAAVAVMGVLDSVAPHRIDSTVLAGVTLVHARSSRPSAYIRSAKWLLDRLGGAALLVLSAPVLGAAWLWVRLESRGPGFFTQTRVGLDGRLFTMFKLRTMRCDAEAAKESLAPLDDGNGMLFKVREDPRVTRSGRFLRRTSLDELPQLLNVVLGHMSLVGPRPALPAEADRYDDMARRRLAIRPGMTGLWQVSGRSDLSWERTVELDLGYTDNYRLLDDLVIGLRTVDAVVRPRGAY